ncbi:hypothetical protein AAVH_09643 [Aphelenchoides avenae]|nr:hypothetical protein AAVH_09643 [Aphelenchus avenae]
MKLPIETSLLVLGFAGRQALGRVLVANRRLSGIVNRHRKTLNLPDIPIPPRLSTSLNLLAFLAVVTLLLLLPIGIVQARLSTESRLRATEGSVSHRESELDPFEWHLVLWTNLFLAMLALADAVKTLRMDRRIADKYTAANSGPRRSSILKEHQELRKDVIGASIAAFTLAGLYGSAALEAKEPPRPNEVKSAILRQLAFDE